MKAHLSGRSQIIRKAVGHKVGNLEAIIANSHSLGVSKLRQSDASRTAVVAQDMATNRKDVRCNNRNLWLGHCVCAGNT